MTAEQRAERNARADAAKRRDRERKEYAENPEFRARKTAHHRVAAAIARGQLTRQPCEHDDQDCAGPVQAHHEDYAKPLDVQWLCDEHHRATHAQTDGRVHA